MKNPLNFKVEIKHSESKDAWNIISTEPGTKYKIARIPYLQIDNKGLEAFNAKKKFEALQIAEYITKILNETKEL